MAIVTTDDKYYTEIANAIREKALLYNDDYDLADTLDLGFDENFQPITKIPPPKMASAITSFWKNGTHKVHIGCDAFSSSSSWGYSPAVDLDGIPYTSANTTTIDLAAPNNGSTYEYYFYIKPDEYHTDYSINVYSIVISSTKGFTLYTNIVKVGNIGSPSTEHINMNGTHVTIETYNTNSGANAGHTIKITVPFSYFYKNYNYEVTGDKTVTMYRPTILDYFYAYLA